MELVKRYTQVTLAAIAELAELSETSIDFKEPLNYTITHNPDNNEIILKLYFSEIGNLIVTLNNILGQQVQELYNGFYDKSLIDILFSIGNLPIGTYYLKIKYNDSIKVEKIIRN